jgi:hypothetical protein
VLDSPSTPAGGHFLSYRTTPYRGMILNRLLHPTTKGTQATHSTLSGAAICPARSVTHAKSEAGE